MERAERSRVDRADRSRTAGSASEEPTARGPAPSVRELVEYLARGLVAHPDRVSVTEVEGEDGAVLEIRVAEEDVARVIGRQGRIIRAIRTLARVAAMRQGRRVAVEVVD